MFKTLMLVLLAGASAQAADYKLLYSPPDNSHVGYLHGVIEQAPDVFYVLGTWDSNTFGPSIVSVSAAGDFQRIHSFPPGTQMVNFVQAPDGKIYGPGYKSAANTYFYYSIDPSGANYQERAMPAPWGSGWNTVVTPADGLYDLAGRVVNGVSIAAFVHIPESGDIKVLHEFTAAEGFPNGSSHLVYGPDGNFYGIGNLKHDGISPGFIYRLTPAGDYSRLVAFPEFPSYDSLPLIAASDGHLYGTFAKGGANNTGEIYQVALNGQLRTVASFPAAGMSNPWTLMQAADGNLYGTTGNSQVFRYNMSTHALTMVYQLNPGGSQGHCACILLEGSDGKLYGLAPNGGNYPGVGALFSLDIGLPEPPPTVSGLYSANGPAGSKVLLWGNYLLGAKSVEFNGKPATAISVTSGQSVWATVPPGATSGPVKITTANGSFTAGNFTVAKSR